MLSGAVEQQDKRDLLLKIYRLLLQKFGNQNWWPGETRDEIIIGAILTQSVSWKNVEKAIKALKKAGLCTLSQLELASEECIATKIRSTLYYNQKVKKLKNFTGYLQEFYNGSLDNFFTLNIRTLRSELLSIKGIGQETADSIILYAAEKPIFVIDAYTKRVFGRLRFLAEENSYLEFQNFFMQNLPEDVELFKDFHAQIVELAKSFCYKKNPDCSNCPLKHKCNYYND